MEPTFIESTPMTVLTIIPEASKAAPGCIREYTTIRFAYSPTSLDIQMALSAMINRLDKCIEGAMESGDEIDADVMGDERRELELCGNVLAHFPSHEMEWEKNGTELTIKVAGVTIGTIRVNTHDEIFLK